MSPFIPFLSDRPNETLTCPPPWPAHQDVGPGWQMLLEEADRLLHSAEVPFTGEVRFRNRFGRLWIVPDYCSPGAREALRAQLPAIRLLQARSERTCEVCGRPGQPTPEKEGWVASLCPEHHAARRRGASWEDLMGYRPGNVPLSSRARRHRTSRHHSSSLQPDRRLSGAADDALQALQTRWLSLATTLGRFVPEAAEAYRTAAEELRAACATSPTAAR